MSAPGDHASVAQALLAAAAAERGHFRYESGHHGDLWLELDALFADARRAQGWAAELAGSAAACDPHVVCGPSAGGAHLAQAIAAQLGAEFTFAERTAAGTGIVGYSLPVALRPRVRGRRILLVDDAVNAGSAWRATIEDLGAWGGEVVGLATLLALGAAAARIAGQTGVPLFTLATVERGLWPPEDRPLCRSGLPLVDRLARR